MTPASQFPISILAVALTMGAAPAVTIDTVYFAQTHFQEPSHSYFYLVGNRETFIKAHVVDPATPASPPVSALLTLDGRTLNLTLTGPATLPASLPNGPGIVQHTSANTFTAIIPKAWVKSGLTVSVTAGAAQADFNTLKIGAPTKVVMTMFDVQYFADTNSDYPAGWREELEAKWPVAGLEVRRIPHVVFPELVIPPRAGVPAARIKSGADYTTQTGLGFDGEQAAALAWNGALKAAAGTSGRVSLYYTNIYGVGAGGQAGGFAGVGSGTSVGILHHELGHALSLPHWGDSTTYPYKGTMHGVAAPAIYNETHAGPTWGFDLRTQAAIPCTVQVNNVGGKTPYGTYKADPMQGGGTGWQEPGYLMNHFSDYSVFKMRSYLEGHVLVWNQALGSFASWNQTARDYTTTVTNNGVAYPVERDVSVISIMASISGANPSVNMVYPPIGPFSGGLIRLFDPAIAADRAAAQAIFSPANGSDLCLRVTQGGMIKTYLVAASWEPTADPLSGGSLKTSALNLPAADGTVTRIDLLLTPDAEDNGLPANPQVLYSWPGSLISTPVGLTATGSDSKITLAWNSSAGATGYQVKRSLTSGGPYTLAGTATNPSYHDTSVTNGTIYYYVVSATTALGESADSAQAVATAVLPPLAPSGLAAVPGDAVVALSWSASAGATRYTLKRSLSASGPFTPIQSQTGTTFNDLTAINSVNYYYRVSAINGGGEGADSATVGPVEPVGPPPAPTGLTAVGGESEVGLSWSAAPGATGYQVKRSLAGGGPYTLIQSVTATSFTDPSVTNGMTYYYVVSATSGNGPSGASAEAFATVSRSRHWDGGTANITANGNGASGGGSGTWNPTLANWDAGAVPHVAWTNGSNDTPIFGGSAGMGTIGAPVTVGGLRFDTAGYTLTGGILTFGTAGVITNSGTATVASEIAGGPAATISKEGEGTLILSGANTYSGGIRVNAGTLQFNAAAAIGGNGRSITAATGTTVAATFAINNASISRFEENGNAFNISMLVASSSPLDLGSATGADLPNAVLCGTGSAANFSGTLAPGGNTFRFANLSPGPTFSNTSLFTVSSALTGAAHSVVISGRPMPVYLTHPGLTYKGSTTVNPGGTLGFDTVSIDNIGGGPGARDITVGAGATLMRRGGNLSNAFLQRIVATDAPFSIIANNAGSGNALDLTLFPNASLATWDNAGTGSFAFTGTITPGANGYLFGSSRAGNYINLNIANSLTGPNKLTVVPGSISKLRITNANNFTGDTLVHSGTLYLTHNLALQNSAIDTAGAGFIDLTGATSPTIGGLKSGRNLAAVITNGYGGVTALTLNVASGASPSYSGVIANGAPAMALTKTGAGTQILTGSSVHTGQTRVTGGTLLVNHPGTLPGGSEVTVSGGTLGGTGTIGGSVTVEANGSLAPGAPVGTLFITGALDLAAQDGGAGKLYFELAAPDAPRDQIAVTGPLILGTGVLGFSDFVFDNLGGLQRGTCKLITSSGVNPGDSLDANDLTGMIDSFHASLRISSDGKDLELVVDSPAGNTYQDWLAANPPATGFQTDSDHDGTSNGVENVLGTDPNAHTAGLTEVAATAHSVTFKHQLNPAIASDVATSYQWSTDLIEWQGDGGTNAGGTSATIAVSGPDGNDGVTVTITLTSGPSARLFGRLVAQTESKDRNTPPSRTQQKP